MRFESRAFTLAKDPEHPAENQDAWQLDAERGIAAIADGVAAGIFSGRWARILAEATVAEPPDPRDPAAFALWLSRRREAWSAQIDVAALAWFQKPKLRQGAFSTLLWVEITPLDQTERKPADPWRLRAFAVGDSCLFHVCRGKLLRAFPVEKAAELEADPVVVGSLDRNRDELVEFRVLDATAMPGDLLVLCTDAVADWALRAGEAGCFPAWDEYWSKSPEAWQEEVASLRNQRRMRYDDATLVLLRMSDGVTAAREGTDAAAGGTGCLPAGAVAAEDSTASIGSQAASAPWPPPAEPDWPQRLKALSKRFASQVAQQLARGIGKVREVRASAEAAVRKCRDRFRPGGDDTTQH